MVLIQQLLNYQITQLLNSSEGSLKQRNRNPQRHRGEDAKKQHVSPHRREVRLFQQQTLEPVDRVREGITFRNGAQPRRKRLKRRNTHDRAKGERKKDNESNHSD